MATKRITATVLDEMLPGDVIWDAEVRGFGVRFRARDRVYMLKIRIAGQLRILTIGDTGRATGDPSVRGAKPSG